MSDFEVLKYMTSCKSFMEDVLGLTVKDFHNEWINAMEESDHLCLLAPRGHGKSTIVEGFVVWNILRNPRIRILIVSMNANKSEDMMNFIKSCLELEKVTELFGEQKSPTWSRNKIRVKNPKGGIQHKEPTLQVLGVTSSQISSHYDMIILDDVQDRQNVATANRRKQIRDWYNTELLEMLEPGGKIINIATRWHEDDLHNYLSEKSMYTTLRYQAINKDTKESLWPERFTYDDLIELRDEHIGATAFAMQYQNEIVQTEDSPIKIDWVEFAQNNWNPRNIPSETDRYIGVDLASKSEEGDYFSVTVVARDKDKTYYVVENIRDKVSMSRQLEIIKSLSDRYAPKKIGIESNATQRIITDEWMENTSLPIEPLKSSWVNDKWSRIQRLAVLLETHRININPDLVNLCDELIKFPRGAHDDCVDSLAFAIQVSGDQRDVDWDAVINSVKTKKRNPYVMKI